MNKEYEKLLDKLFTLEQTKDYTLDKIKKATFLLWNPQNKFKIIHVAWTNGKWSVSKMCFSILRHAWKKVWVFTSPHLITIRERFESSNWKISEEDFVNIMKKILKLDIDLSYFEYCVLIALLYFEKENCEYAILEVWVWWTLDTTNIVNPVITTICSIWMDHQHILWNTIDEISSQKAWIIKENIPVVLNFRNKIIEKKAKKENSRIIFTNNKTKTNLLWDFQKSNASLAYEICNYLWIPETIITEGLQIVNHLWRMQFVSSNLLIDWAHNEDSLNKLKEYVDNELEWKFDKINYCFWLKKNKEINIVTDIFWENKNYILVDIKNSMLEDLTKYKDKFPLKTKENIIKLSDKNKHSLYVVFGSLYMIWEFLK